MNLESENQENIRRVFAGLMIANLIFAMVASMFGRRSYLFDFQANEIFSWIYILLSVLYFFIVLNLDEVEKEFKIYWKRPVALLLLFGISIYKSIPNPYEGIEFVIFGLWPTFFSIELAICLFYKIKK